MSGADYFTNAQAINAYMDNSVCTNTQDAIVDHQAIRQALQQAGIEVVQVRPPKGCQDGVYTANWGLARNSTVILSSLPNARKGEEAYAEDVLKKLGKKLIQAPYRFSGQGDSLPIADYLLAGSGYRTDPRMHNFIHKHLGYRVIPLQTIPALDKNKKPIINPISGWPDSFFYDIDLAVSVITDNLIAWCPDAFTPSSQDIIAHLPFDKIEVSYQEATEGLGCNLVSTGTTVVMSNQAPKLQSALVTKGFKILTPKVTELQKGGGFIRCTTLSLDNP